ncbi:Hypothetical predicted protein, partial [Paramuricea clavata]
KVSELLKIFPQQEQVYLAEEAVISILNEQCDQPELKTFTSTLDQEMGENPKDAIIRFRQCTIEKTLMRQPIFVNRSSDTIIKEVLKLFKPDSIDIRKKT